LMISYCEMRPSSKPSQSDGLAPLRSWGIGKTETP
jgi:hypothetical protein